jgi:hypothetical protein
MKHRFFVDKSLQCCYMWCLKLLWYTCLRKLVIMFSNINMIVSHINLWFSCRTNTGMICWQTTYFFVTTFQIQLSLKAKRKRCDYQDVFTYQHNTIVLFTDWLKTFKKILVIHLIISNLILPSDEFCAKSFQIIK